MFFDVSSDRLVFYFEGNKWWKKGKKSNIGVVWLIKLIKSDLVVVGRKRKYVEKFDEFLSCNLEVLKIGLEDVVRIERLGFLSRF